ncbi:MAG: putative zinc-binding metallopeptidase [Candidatus Competibacteraceae bacterium]|nr:putative zinc-binding metallopeptidase [Candidatus Competibacteraceae bacterium]
MSSLLSTERLAPDSRSALQRVPKPLAWRSFRCQCGRAIFFENSRCLGCGTPLGYELGAGRVIPLAHGMDAGTWAPFGQQTTSRYRRCANFEGPSGCNWLIPIGDATGKDTKFCLACTLNRTIPNLSNAENGRLWGLIEVAKRRLVSSLLALGLPVEPKSAADPERGIAFDFLSPTDHHPRVITGHDNGVITLNIEEADDAKREKIRAAMHEPYRTLLGHFRHEIGHYYWDRLVRDSEWLDDYRALFGDERADYATALRRHYENGPPADWPQHFVTSYASTHPWEDWAETWAHYLHMVDTLDTAHSFGLEAHEVDLEIEPFTTNDLWRIDAENGEAFLRFLNDWIRIATVVTELSRSMGQPDFYPFSLPHAAISKLHFVHSTVQRVGNL